MVVDGEAPELGAEEGAAREVEGTSGGGAQETVHAVSRNYDATGSLRISPAAYAVLAAASGEGSIAEVIERSATRVANTELLAELFNLWSERYVAVSPGQYPDQPARHLHQLPQREHA